MRSALIAVVLTASLFPSAASYAAETKPKYQRTLQNCERAYIRDILRKPKHKAVATTGGRPLGVHPTGCGFAAGHPTVKAARAAALAECRKQEGPRNPGKCKVIEVQ
jgi:hypothetical protein